MPREKLIAQFEKTIRQSKWIKEVSVDEDGIATVDLDPNILAQSLAESIEKNYIPRSEHEKEIENMLTIEQHEHHLQENKDYYEAEIARLKSLAEKYGKENKWK